MFEYKIFENSILNPWHIKVIYKQNKIYKILFDNKNNEFYRNFLKKLKKKNYKLEFLEISPFNIIELLEKYFIEKKDPPFIEIKNIKKEKYRVLKYLKEHIKLSQTITYSQLSNYIYNIPIYRRKIALFMKTNNFPIIYPCHRVVGKNSYGGFTPSIDLKIKLLSFEKNI